jgi:hypothetical protein
LDLISGYYYRLLKNCNVKKQNCSSINGCKSVNAALYLVIAMFLPFPENKIIKFPGNFIVELYKGAVIIMPVNVLLKLMSSDIVIRPY